MTTQPQPCSKSQNAQRDNCSQVIGCPLSAPRKALDPLAALLAFDADVRFWFVHHLFPASTNCFRIASMSTRCTLSRCFSSCASITVFIIGVWTFASHASESFTA